LLRRDPNGDSTNVKARSPLLANREVKRFMKLQTNRIVARQPGGAGRPVDAMRASFTERARANSVSFSKMLAERIVP
jgi:hypothetical protein